MIHHAWVPSSGSRLASLPAPDVVTGSTLSIWPSRLTISPPVLRTDHHKYLLLRCVEKVKGYLHGHYMQFHSVIPHILL